MHTDEIRADLGCEVITDDGLIAEVAAEIGEDILLMELTTDEMAAVTKRRDCLINVLADEPVGVGAMDIETGERMFAGESKENPSPDWKRSDD